MPAHPAAYTARNADTLMIRAGGCCTAVLCTRLKKLLESCLRPQTTLIAFDLAGVEMIDSTFAGMLLATALRKGEDAPAVCLVAPSEGVLGTLDNMHVRHLFTIREDAPAQVRCWEELSVERPGAHEVARIVIDAHEHLVAADDRNEAAFARVLEGMRACLKEGAGED